MKKRFILFSLFVVVLVVLTSCHKTIGGYYIKYEVEISGNTLGGYTFATMNTDHGLQEFEISRSFSEIFGPVRRNFTAHIEMYCTKSSQAIYTVRIYACKGEETFALKKTKDMRGPTSNNPFVLDYKIDF